MTVADAGGRHLRTTRPAHRESSGRSRQSPPHVADLDQDGAALVDASCPITLTRVEDLVADASDHH